MPRYPLLEHWRNLLAPAAAVEDAVMTDFLGYQITLAGFGKVLGDGQRRLGLADAGNIVALALDRQQRGVGDRTWIDLAAAMRELALGQLVLLEHILDRLDVELLGHV